MAWKIENNPFFDSWLRDAYVFAVDPARGPDVSVIVEYRTDADGKPTLVDCGPYLEFEKVDGVWKQTT
jgi:hypothetical protein